MRGRVQGVEPRARRRSPVHWRVVRQHVRAEREHVASRRVRRAETGRPRALAHGVGRVQALHARGVPRCLPDGRALPHGIRHRRRPGGCVQRLRLLRARVPVRRARQARPARHDGSTAVVPRQERGRARMEVHALLRPPQGRARAGVRDGVPDEVDPVRAARRAARARRRARREAAGRRRPRRAAVRPRSARRRRRNGRVLPAARRSRGVRPTAGSRRVDEAPAVDVGEHGGRGGRARRRRRRRGAAPMTETRSYYGRPVLKEPVWTWAIPVYFFTGGLAGASSVLSLVAKLRGNQKLATTALYIGAAADVASPLLLISDLGRPERFHHILRVFKPTSPMNVGAWILLASGGASNTAALLELTGRLRAVKLAAEVVAALSGPPLATYTGVLVADTAVPVWHEGRHELPWLFGASACASAGAAACMLLDPPAARPARRARRRRGGGGRDARDGAPPRRDRRGLPP